MTAPSLVKRAYLWLPLLLPAYLLRFHIGPVPTTVLECGVVLFTLAWFVACGKQGMSDAWKRSVVWHKPAIAWLIVGAISVIVAGIGDGSESIQLSRFLPGLGLFRAYFIEPLLIFFIGWDLIRTDDDREQLWRSFSIVTILLALWAIVQMITGWGIPHPWEVWPGRRSTGPFPFPNALALFVTPIAALAMTRVVRKLNAMKEAALHRDRSVRGTPVREMWMDVGVVISGITAILLARSDGGLVAFGAATFVTFLLHKHTRRFAIELAVVGILVLAFVAPIRERVAEVVLFKEWSGKVRTIIWKETFTMLRDTSTPIGMARPLLGAGLGAYPTAILPYHKATWMEVFQYPHTILLNLWSEVGVLGALAFGWMIVTWFRATSRHNRVASIAVMIAILVHGLVDVPYFKNDLAIVFWLLILLTVTQEQHQQHQKN